jgi:hypothetical protein
MASSIKFRELKSALLAAICCYTVLAVGSCTYTFLPVSSASGFGFYEHGSRPLFQFLARTTYELRRVKRVSSPRHSPAICSGKPRRGSEDLALEATSSFSNLSRCQIADPSSIVPFQSQPHGADGEHALGRG